MRIAMTFPQAGRYEASIGGAIVHLAPKPHALLEMLLIHRGLWVEWADIYQHLGIAGDPQRRAHIHHAVQALRAHGVQIDNAYRTGYRLPLDVPRRHKLSVESWRPKGVRPLTNRTRSA